MPTLDCLPVEVQRLICLFVVDYSWHDLAALSRTCQDWHDLAATELYRYLRIAFCDRTQLLNAISELHTDGLGRQYLRYARTLELVCLKKPGLETKTAKQLWQQKNWANIHTLLQDSLFQICDSSLFFLTSTLAYYRQDDWEPILSLLSRLQHLQLLSYAVRNMFPTCLLQALQRSHPACRLNVWTPQSPTLDLPGLGRSHRCVGKEFKQPFDLEILRSPALHTLNAVYTVNRDPHQGWIHIDEPLSFVFMAPNLKHLLLDDMHGRHDNPIRKVKKEWQEFTSKVKPSSPVVCIDSLTFINGDPQQPHESILFNISTMIDLSRLRSLDLGVHSEPAMLGKVASILVHLERLYVGMVPWNKPRTSYTEDNSVDAASDNEEMISAVQTFRSLRFLCLRGLWNFSSLDRILSYHHNLEGLSLETSEEQRRTPHDGPKYPISNGEHIRSIARLCPRLQELRMPLQRSRGSAQECEIYKALGQLLRIHTVHLDLDCNPRRTPREDEVPSPSSLREILINSAVDESLVTEIFNLVFFHQETRKIKYIRVNLVGADLFRRELEHVIRQLGRSFLVTRKDFYLNEEVLVDVKEIGRVAWQLWREDEIGYSGPIQIPREVKEVLEELWPLQSDRNRSKKWKEFPLLVRSFPLATM
ncbi:hypothetical protein ASPTUDRAFT_79798 [Aspergillus tubingensis CBS 134.48]|uniref:F-box domain-containing protein n=1 Tax=Aspergillus tubingensis (strain CBS 134.48) TaxID=767770 RepID=A0A1L9NHK3_ASPTC|nr:hypothetical protein ASPTUDRAFT_79798 [Aspergillus tubingensis CBS 134.48]